MVVHSLTSKCANLSCSLLTDGNICVTHTPVPFSTFLLPQILGAPSQSIPGRPHSLRSNTYSELFLPQISFASSETAQKWNHPERYSFV